MLRTTSEPIHDVGVSPLGGHIAASFDGRYIAVTNNAHDKCIVTVYSYEASTGLFDVVSEQHLFTLEPVGVLFFNFSIPPTVLVWTSNMAQELQLRGKEKRVFDFRKQFEGCERLRLVQVGGHLMAAFGRYEHKLSFVRLRDWTGGFHGTPISISFPTSKWSKDHHSDMAVSQSFDGSHALVLSLCYKTDHPFPKEMPYTLLSRLNERGHSDVVFVTPGRVSDVCEVRPDRFAIAMDCFDSPKVKVVNRGVIVSDIHFPDVKMSLYGDCLMHLPNMGLIVRSLQTKLSVIREQPVRDDDFEEGEQGEEANEE
jgi:hypothetical protein